MSVSDDHYVEILCSWGIKEGWLIPLVDKPVGGR